MVKNYWVTSAEGSALLCSDVKQRMNFWTHGKSERKEYKIMTGK